MNFGYHKRDAKRMPARRAQKENSIEVAVKTATFYFGERGEFVLLGSFLFYILVFTSSSRRALTFVLCDKSKQKRTRVPTVRKDKKLPSQFL